MPNVLRSEQFVGGYEYRGSQGERYHEMSDPRLARLRMRALNKNAQRIHHDTNGEVGWDKPITVEDIESERRNNRYQPRTPKRKDS